MAFRFSLLHRRLSVLFYFIALFLCAFLSGVLLPLRVFLCLFPLCCSDSFSCGSYLRDASFMSHRSLLYPLYILVFPSISSPFGAISPFEVLCGVFAVYFCLPLLIPFALFLIWVLRGLLSSFHWASSWLRFSVVPWVVLRFVLLFSVIVRLHLPLPWRFHV